MDCQTCEQFQRKFTCTICLNERLREHRKQFERLTVERNTHDERVAKVLKVVEGPRTIRATIATTDARANELRRETDALWQNNDETRTRVAAMRTQLATRRTNLLTARSFQPHSLLNPMHEWANGIDEINHQNVRARASLVEELVEAFDLAETEVRGPQRPMGLAGSMLFAFPRIGLSQTRPEWTIAGLPLPLPSNVHKSPPEEVNAALVHTLHFLRVLCTYLGVKLPFEVTWSGQRVGVGMPSLRAGPGSSSGNWSKWTSPCPLQLPTPGALSPVSAPSNPDIFALAYCMLAYNVCYLAYTQTVIVPLHQSGEILFNLWTACSSSNVGRFSHQTSSSAVDAARAASIYPSPIPMPLGVAGSTAGVAHPPHHGRMLASPTTSAFPLDFDTMVEHLTGKKLRPPPERTSRKSGLSMLLEDEYGEEWAMVEKDDEEDFALT